MLWNILGTVCILLREEPVSVSNSVKPVVSHKLPGTLWTGNLETGGFVSVLLGACSVTMNKSLHLLDT